MERAKQMARKDLGELKQEIDSKLTMLQGEITMLQYARQLLLKTEEEWNKEEGLD